ncbi:MAG TPA: hypothetical protein VIJ79_17645 [Acidobacteriaceae bacterium]
MSTLKFAFRTLLKMRSTTLFDGAAIYTKCTWALTDHSDNGLDVILSGMVTPDFFRVLQPNATLGTATSDNGPRTVVLSYAYWQKRYQGDPNVTSLPWPRTSP